MLTIFLSNLLRLITENRRKVVMAILILILIIAVILLYRQCSKPTADLLNQDAIIRQQKEIKDAERQRLIDAIHESEDRLRKIEEQIREQERETERLRREYDNLSNEQLRQEIERRAAPANAQ